MEAPKVDKMEGQKQKSTISIEFKQLKRTDENDMQEIIQFEPITQNITKILHYNIASQVK